MLTTDVFLFWLALIAAAVVPGNRSPANDGQTPRTALIVEPEAINTETVSRWKKEAAAFLVVVLDERFDASVYKRASQAAATGSLDIYYWIEVGRHPAFAEEHPEWLASIGSHEDWRKLFREVPKRKKDEVVKAWPWTPIAYRKTFDAHLTRIKALLERVPSGYRGVLLNDLQGGPTSCGCGNLQCRWAIDYGVPATTEKFSGHDVAVRFLAQVEKFAPSKEVIPVWTIECEQEDMALGKEPKRDWSTGYCGDVDCCNYCLARFAEQWNALLEAYDGPVAILLLHKEFRRTGKDYGPAAGWVSRALGYLKERPKKNSA